MPPGCLPLFIFVAFIIFIPLFFANAMLVALGKLGLSPGTSLLAASGIFIGGMFNVPIKRIDRDEIIDVTPFSLFGFGRIFPQFLRRRTYTVIALNVGGCLVPAAIAVYEVFRLASLGPGVLLATIAAVVVNVAVCYWLARPVPQLGIALPAIMPALVAALCGLLFVPDMAPALAFVGGVAGPLIGADLLHLRQIERISTGVASIGGAGTFDGIVISALVATLLA